MVRKPSEPLAAKVSEGHEFFDIVEEAYRVFDYPKPQSTEVCVGCCMNPEIEAHFFDPPIRALPLDYIQDWYCAAYNPEGIAKATWAYLLPRILEILASGEDASNLGPEVSLQRFDTGNAGNWSKEEWHVLDRFQRMYLRRELAGLAGGGDHYLDDVLCMFRLGGWPLDELLGQVLASSDAELATRLWRDWCSCLPGRESIWMTSFWRQPDNSTAFAFYTSEELRGRIEALALADDTTPDLASKASAVVSVIEMSV